MDYQATEKLQLNASVTYNKADSSWDWGFSERAPVLIEGGAQAGDPLNQGTAATGPYSPANYDNWELNNLIDSYSDLSYEQYQLTLGGTYNFTPNCYATTSLTYDKFISDEEYVYGDEDGSAYYGYLGVGYRF